MVKFALFAAFDQNTQKNGISTILTKTTGHISMLLVPYGRNINFLHYFRKRMPFPVNFNRQIDIFLHISAKFRSFPPLNGSATDF